jgi:uncharacterized protein (DUF433 family)
MGQTASAGEIYPGVTVDPETVHDQPVIAGTRIPVAVIVGHLAAGDRLETVMDAYKLTEEQVRAALGYAAQLVSSIDELRDPLTQPRYYETDEWLRHLGVSEERIQRANAQLAAQEAEMDASAR